MHDSFVECIYNVEMFIFSIICIWYFIIKSKKIDKEQSHNFSLALTQSECIKHRVGERERK